jgi:hypothetical protein
LDEGAAATPHGQLVFFAEFLATTGVFERFAACCPLACRSGNAPDKRDVLGTLMLGGAAPHVGSMPMDAGSTLMLRPGEPNRTERTGRVTTRQWCRRQFETVQDGMHRPPTHAPVGLPCGCQRPP